MSEVKLQTGRNIFEVLAHMRHSPLESLEQFVENGADAVEQAGISDGCIRISLERSPSQQDRPSLIVVEDNGIGMSAEKMRAVAQRIGDSEKVDQVLRGEKGIGILSFASIANELHLCSHNAHDSPASCLVLRRDWLRDGLAQVITSCPQHPHLKRGTRAYLIDILPEVAPQLTQARLKRHLGREFAEDLRRNVYTMLVGDRHGYEPIKPRQFQGIPMLITTLDLGAYGRAAVELYALPVETPEAAVDLFGKGGVRLCALTSLEEFQGQPWLDRRLEGTVHYDRLQSTTDKTAVVQNETYKALTEALHSLETQITEKVGQIAQEYRDSRLSEIMRRVNIFIGHFLHYMETGYATEMPKRSNGNKEKAATEVSDQAAILPQTDKLNPEVHSTHRRGDSHPSYLQADLCLPASDAARLRTWSNEAGAIQINTLHSDFLTAERDDTQCAWYLFSAWAKQYLLTEYGSEPTIMADEMVGLFSHAGPLLNQMASRPRNGHSALPKQTQS